MDKTKALQIFTNEERRRVTGNMWALEQLSSEKTQALGKATTGKLQALQKFIKTDNKSIQIQTQKFRGKPTSSLPYEIREEQPKVIKTPIVIHSVTIQEILPRLDRKFSS